MFEPGDLNCLCNTAQLQQGHVSLAGCSAYQPCLRKGIKKVPNNAFIVGCTGCYPSKHQTPVLASMQVLATSGGSTANNTSSAWQATRTESAKLRQCLSIPDDTAKNRFSEGTDWTRGTPTTCCELITKVLQGGLIMPLKGDSWIRHKTNSAPRSSDRNLCTCIHAHVPYQPDMHRLA
jgi:hypothetical protein